MQEATSEFSCVVSSKSGRVYGVAVDGVVVRFRDETVRRLTHTTRIAVDFDDCEIQRIYQPSPAPAFPITHASISDDDRSVLLLSERNGLHFGVMHLDRSCLKSDSCTVPYVQAQSVEAEAVRVRWFPGCHQSLGVLRMDATFSVYDASRLAYPECVYRLKRDVNAVIGIASTRLPSPIDFTFLGFSTWGWASILVLYEDGAIFLLSPVLPVGDVTASLLTSARLRPIPRPLLKGLLIETMGRHLDDALQLVPYLQGPLNYGLDSFRGDAFSRGKAASAVALSFAHCTDGAASVTVGMSNGSVYSHVMLRDVEPRCLRPSEATVTPMGVRLCIPYDTGAQLRLMETIHLKERRFKGTMSIDQDSEHPEVFYVHVGDDMMRLRVSWAESMISGSISELSFGKSEIWRFDHHAQFLGSFHNLDTSVAVFRLGHRTYASILRPFSLIKSALEHLPPEATLSGRQSNEDENDIPLEDAVGEMQGADTMELKDAFQRYCYLMLETTEFDGAILKLEDAATEYEETIAALESKLQSVTVHTSKTISAVKETNADAWRNGAILGDLIVVQKQLDEMMGH